MKNPDTTRKEKEMICIVCPVGCHLKAVLENGKVTVTGNQCPRGEEHGREEITDPKRIVTATCTLTDSRYERLPVRTDKPIGLEYIDGLLAKIYSVRVTAPVKAGDVIIENYRNTSVNIISARTLE